MTTYIESGIYTNYTVRPSIYIGKKTNDGELRDSFCDVPMKFNRNTTKEDVVKFLRKKGTKILDCIIMLHSDNTDYNYNYSRQLPNTLYYRIDKRAKEWSTKP